MRIDAVCNRHRAVRDGQGGHECVQYRKVAESFTGAWDPVGYIKRLEDGDVTETAVTGV